MKKIFPLILALAVFQPLQSQHKLGLGVYLGAPTGVTGKFILSNSNSVDLTLAWRFNDALFLQGHYIFNLSELQRYGDGTFNLYAGPGLFFKASSKKDDFIGASANLGVNFFLKKRYEFFIEISPKLGLIPGTDFDITGGIGFRFFF
jgi:hypothetical protein